MNQRLRYKYIVEKRNDIIEDLYGYIDEIDNSWSKNLVPTTDDKIEKFIEVSRIAERGYVFPKEYVLYLKCMGENDGGLLSEVYDGTSNIDDLISHYTRYGDRLYDDFEMKVNQLLIFFSDMETEYYITFNDDGSHIITANHNNLYEIDAISESFDKMLFQMAFYKYERKCFKHIVRFNASKDKIINKFDEKNIIDIIDVFARKEGFLKAWFCDKWHYISIKETASLYVDLGCILNGYIVSDNIDELNNLVNKLCNIIDISIQV